MAKDGLSGTLAVILHADVAGSTALVQQDKQLAHERIQESFRRFSDTIEKHQGRVLELRGDICAQTTLWRPSRKFYSIGCGVAHTRFLGGLRNVRVDGGRHTEPQADERGTFTKLPWHRCRGKLGTKVAVIISLYVMSRFTQFRPFKYLLQRMTATGFAVVFLTGMIAGCADYRSTRGKSDTLGEYEIGILPHLREFRRIGKRPDEPFVMVNMLIYKNRAKGADFEGLSGAEAYQLYFDGLAGAQSEIGSRLIWAGRVQTQFVGNSDPVFETIALLEYAGPKTFTAFAKKPGDAPKARTAGLLGQWLIASTTLEEAQSSIELDSPDESPFDQADLKKTGLTASQIERLREGPADEPLFIFDLLRFTDASGERYRPYREALSVATTLHGGMVLWRGSVDSLVIGKSSPSFHEIAVTQYPDRVAYLSALSDPDVVAVAESWTNGLALRWSFTASEKTDWGLAGSELGATG